MDQSEPPTPTLHRALRAALLSAAIVILYAIVVFIQSNFCWVYLYGAPRAIILTTFLCVYGFIFFFLRFRGRAVLVVCTIAAYLLPPHIDRIHPAVTAQVEAVGRLRGTNAFLEEYRSTHPQHGFPSTIAEIRSTHEVEKFYKFNYKPLRLRAEGPFDDYVLTALPVRPNCGCTYRLATSSDLRIHFTTESRPATIGDKVLESR